MTIPLRLVFRRLTGLEQACEPGGDLADRLLSCLFGDAEAQVWLDSSQANQAEPDQPCLSIVAGSGGPLSHVLYGDARAEQNTFTQVGDMLNKYSVDIPAQWPYDFALGWMGAFGYELRHHATGMPEPQSPHVSALPDAALVFCDRAVVINHAGWIDVVAFDSEANRQWMDEACAAVRRLAETPAWEATATAPSPTPAPTPARFVFDHSTNEYMDCIDQAQQAISAGDTYEVCLTTTATGPASVDPRATYRRLRRTSPVPYGAFLHFRSHNLSILSASPERFLKVSSAGQVSAKPIKGTRRRGAGVVEDQALVRDLDTHPKDRAENLMIVDLLRNDLGRVCVPGSIRVPRLCAVETFSHVHQLVSTIEGTLLPDCGPAELMAACFPGGSMTGAPKISTMELIDQLERRPRGFYSGSIGWLSPNGAADLSITIRTLVDDGQQCTFGVGGAIVADSDPEDEYQEILTKSAALVEALGASVV